MVVDNELRSSNDVIKHHGILGMKWGKKNGPPYPLDPKKDYSKAEKKAMEKEETRKKVTPKASNKEEAKTFGSATDLDAYKNELSNEEIRKAIERIQLYHKIRNLKSKEFDYGKYINVEGEKLTKKELEKEIKNSADTYTSVANLGLRISQLVGALK